MTLISALAYRQTLNYRSAQEKSSFLRFAAVHPLREIICFAEKNKNHLFRRGFSPRNFAEKLREISWRHSARFREETPRTFAMGRNAQPDMSLHSTGHKTNSESLRPQYNHLMCDRRKGKMYM